MGYDLKKWKARIAERSDLSGQVVHLTKSSMEKGKKVTGLTNLKKILTEKSIKGSDNNGYVVGKTSAACFQDAPLSAVCQNTYFEQKYRKSNPKAKVRYNPIGIMFPKEYVYKKGGRPVLYEKTSVAKVILPEEDWWRIVNFDMSDQGNIIDWTHEREWRCPGDFEFDIEQATILFVKASHYRYFSKWDKKQDEEVLDKVKSLVVLSDILY